MARTRTVIPCLKTHYPNRYWSNDELIMVWFLALMTVALGMACWAFIVHVTGGCL